MTLTLDNGAEEPNPTYCDGLYNGRPIPGLRVVNVSITLPYSDEVEAFRPDYLLDEDSPTVALKLTFSTSNPDENVEIYLPNINCDSNLFAFICNNLSHIICCSSTA